MIKFSCYLHEWRELTYETGAQDIYTCWIKKDDGWIKAK